MANQGNGLDENLIHSYQNGNCAVKLFADGTREIEWPDGEVKSPSVPFNMDVKITNFCDSTAGCMSHCHEKSNLKGRHSNLLSLSSIFKGLPQGVEVAIGGGNTLSHPDLLPFLQILKGKGLVANATVNQFHFKELFYSLIDEISEKSLVYGLGCSVTSPNLENVRPVYSKSHLVFHLILGIHSIEDVKRIHADFENPKILLLGYKQFGNGTVYYSKRQKRVDENIFQWYSKIHQILGLEGLVLSFDNLAISQLNLKRFFTKDNWDVFYQGEDEGLESSSMYIDLEKEEFSFSSRHPERFPIQPNMRVQEMFSHLKTQAGVL